MKNGQYGTPDAEGLFPTALPANPFLLAGMVGGIVAGLLYLLLLWRREGLQKMMPSANDLDRVTYKIICIAFPLLTLMIAAGAYWANQTWGSYWSWDPKETWAAITWLVYAGYLHMRITRGWKRTPRRLVCHPGFCRGDLHLLRRDLPAARSARLRCRLICFGRKKAVALRRGGLFLWC